MQKKKRQRNLLFSCLFSKCSLTFHDLIYRVKLGVLSKENDQEKRVFIMSYMIIMGSDKTQSTKKT